MVVRVRFPEEGMVQALLDHAGSCARAGHSAPVREDDHELGGFDVGV